MGYKIFNSMIKV